jgi:hypothetical protein
MTQVEVLDARRDASGGYKVDLKRNSELSAWPSRNSAARREATPAKTGQVRIPRAVSEFEASVRRYLNCAEASPCRWGLRMLKHAADR